MGGGIAGKVWSMDKRIKQGRCGYWGAGHSKEGVVNGWKGHSREGVVIGWEGYSREGVVILDNNLFCSASTCRLPCAWPQMIMEHNT